MSKPIVAVVGRPNVGKSTLFNKLCGQRLAIVEDTPGITRDRIFANCEWSGHEFLLVDTGGIEPKATEGILAHMREQAQIAIDTADCIIMVVDVRNGLTAADEDVAHMLRRSHKPIILAVNKCDNVGETPMELYEFYNLGFDEVMPISSVHGHGTGDLLDAFQWKCTLVRDYLLPGNGYTYVDWVSNRIDGLYYVDPMQVSAEIGADPIFKTARFFIGGRSYRDYEIMRILRNTRDGVTGSGLVAESPIQLETMLNALKYENRMVKTGAKKGFLKVEKDKKVSQTVLDQLRNSWRKMYGPDSEETTVILNDGVDFKDAGQTAVETQLNENKQTNAHEIYRIFNIAPTILEGDATAEDLKNTVRFAIAPVVKALQLAINRFCLLEAEKGVLAFEIDMDALDGTDMLARYQAYEVAIRNGWMQLDEVRYDEGRNPLGLKFIRLGLDTVIYDPESRMIYTPNTKEWASIDQKGGGEPIAGRDPSG